MTTEVRNPAKVTAIVETTTARKRKEEGSRLHVHLSFPLRANGELSLMLQEQLGNPIEITFDQPMQIRLSAATLPETETVNATVDGQPAKIKRTKVTNETKARLEAMQQAGKANHVFITRSEDEFCETCGQPSESGVHIVPTWTERYNHYLNDPESSGHEMLVNAADLATDDVSNGFAQQLTEEEAALRETLSDEGLSDTAKALLEEIEESRRTPATEAEAEEQAQAEAALAAAGR